MQLTELDIFILCMKDDCVSVQNINGYTFHFPARYFMEINMLTWYFGIF